MEKKLNRYQLLEEIGRGGIGTVYKARDLELNRIVAVKVLEIKSVSPIEVQRFIREAKVIAKFQHPNIVTIHDIIVEKDRLFFSMDLIEGDTLEGLVAVRGRFNEKEALSIVAKIAKVLQAIHAKGIIHRDIKPSNIMITPDKDIMLLDFGTAKLEGETTMTQTGAFVGTLAFAAPEQLNQAKDVSTRSDIYSLGATFYYMLAGEAPYQGTAMEIMYQHCFAPVPTLDDYISSHTNQVIQKMMAKKSQERYQNLQQLIQNLSLCQGKKTANMPLWAHYMAESKVIDDKYLKVLGYTVVETGNTVLNMASPYWYQLKPRMQSRCAKSYQRSYAKAYGLEVEKTFSTDDSSMVMRLIPPGRFLMGAPPEEAQAGESPMHPVVITQAFWLGKYPVTQRQWKAVTSQTPWRGQPYVLSGAEFPAIYLSWLDIQEYFLPNLPGEFCLPTEAQWEYAFRAGATSSYFWGDEPAKIARYTWNSENTHNRRESYPHPVGKKKSNHWGLYDMAGNVWEKCIDCYAVYSPEEMVDPAGPPKGLQRIERGGAWDCFASHFRCARRSFVKPESCDATGGFRLARRETLH